MNFESLVLDGTNVYFRILWQLGRHHFAAIGDEKCKKVTKTSFFVSKKAVFSAFCGLVLKIRA